tara:strand:+ start:321 stop:536 length:216 start_codon:yes stop_codon:yes gene_type:complete
MKFTDHYQKVIRYKGFLLIKEPNESWLIRPQRSPMLLLPFRIPLCSLAKAKQILNRKLSSIKQENNQSHAA